MTEYQRILLTGGTGFVGSYLAPALAKAYPEAKRALLVQNSGEHNAVGWDVVQADLQDTEAVERAVDLCQPDLVVHLAAQASVAASISDQDLTTRVNADGSANLARSLSRHVPGATVLFTSSSEVYGASFKSGTVDEDSALEPLSAYGRSKCDAEQAFEQILPATSKLIIARPFNHTGPRQDERFVLPSFAAQIARIEAGIQQPRIDVGDLSARRDFLHVRDVVSAYLSLIEAGSGLGERVIVNISSGQSYRLSDLLDELQRLSTALFEIHVARDRLRPSDIAMASGANAKLIGLTGWQPHYSIQEVLADLLDYWRERIKINAV
ncbi:GDP-mannose 4,6-dehydratase [Phyllobacterium lublinensis]|uniref:GDP-mannose 4,6-dehydratase n=1 Tax=Phyllobacterium lublinensis TaxID=2875708 RepID=UPI001CC962FC|nr:GDP-mannose 4,6-dehydratase [Phyllobacterium sp. 2063]MBZ9656069.1 GDP-mannose 4,6-dehydratase [Phyllobacterium sp. 2063]